MPKSRDFRNWKRYRGGWAPDLWVFDLTTLASTNVTNDPANDAQPDVARRHDLLPVRPRREPALQHLGLGPDARARPGRSPRSPTSTSRSRRSGPTPSCSRRADASTWSSCPARSSSRCRSRSSPTETTLRPAIEKVVVAPPVGERVAERQARGLRGARRRLHGARRARPGLDLTRSSDRRRAVSPLVARRQDGGVLERPSGEYQLTAAAGGRHRQRNASVTSLGPGFRYAPAWSPDSRTRSPSSTRRCGFTSTTVTASRDEGHGPERRCGCRTAPSRRSVRLVARLAVARLRPPGGRAQQRHLPLRHEGGEAPAGDERLPERLAAGVRPRRQVPLLRVGSRRSTRSTAASTTAGPTPNPTRLVAVAAARRTSRRRSPAQRRREKSAATPEGDKRKPGRGEAGRGRSRSRSRGEERRPRKPPPPAVNIDLDGFEARAVVLPPKAGNYADLQAVEGKLLYRRLPRAGSGDDEAPDRLLRLRRARGEDGPRRCRRHSRSRSTGRSCSSQQGQEFAIVELKPNQKFEKPMATADMEAPVNPRAEWRQMFTDVLPLRARLLLRPGHARRGLGRRCATATASCSTTRSRGGT